MKVLVVGLDHDVQWKDPTGDFSRLLESCLRDADIALIAEEAHKLPTTVGHARAPIGKKNSHTLTLADARCE